MRRLIAKWNPARCVWETPQVALCGHSVPFLATFPPSGTMRNGIIYEPPTQDHATGEKEYSYSPGQLLPSPVASYSENTPENHLRKKPGRTRVTDLKIIVENGLIPTGGRLLKTPTAQLAVNGGSQDPAKRRAGGHGPTLADQVEYELLPTPQAHDAVGGKTPEQVIAMRERGRAKGKAPGVSNLNEVVPALLSASSAHCIVDWAGYSRAILRWQQVLGRMVPSPTEPSPRGKLVLSPLFVEWMMGLEEGRVTGSDAALPRNAQLKILGNGVVPQQAALALAVLLSRASRSEEAVSGGLRVQQAVS